ncbi:MAG: hypothetical protein OEO83_13040 [Alphaproteobacteria bacterium]|nr:hypothetical protein [Alphaproteobacteria bacterium]
MPYVRQFRTGDGYATALVETFIDHDGKARTRVLADLMGTGSAEEALAQLARQHEALRREAVEIAPRLAEAQECYAAIRKNLENGRAYGFDELKQIDRLCALRRRLIGRVLQIEDALTRIKRDKAAIQKHCG